MIVPDAFLMVKVDHASAVPVMVGVLSPVLDPFAGEPTDGAVGAIVSTVNVVTTGAVVLFARSVRVTE
jgi:hypothetical protein